MTDTGLRTLGVAHRRPRRRGHRRRTRAIRPRDRARARASPACAPSRCSAAWRACADGSGPAATPALATVLLAGVGRRSSSAAYLAASPRDPDGTTEVAALVTLAAGVLAGVGFMALASAVDRRHRAPPHREVARPRDGRADGRDGREGRRPVRRDGRRADAAAAGGPVRARSAASGRGSCGSSSSSSPGISFAGYIARLFVGAQARVPSWRACSAASSRRPA